MKRRAASLLLMVLLAISLVCSALAEADDAQKAKERNYVDYMDTGKRFAVEAGDVYGDVARDLFKAGTTLEYASVADMLESLRTGKVDAVLLSHGYVRQLMDSGLAPDFDYLWVPKDVYVNEAGPIFHTAELRDQYNEWFRGIKNDGTWDEIVNRWIGVPLPADEDIPRFELTGENGTLKMCDTGNYPPLIYFDANGEPAGFDVEMMSLFAQHMGMKLELTMMAYEAIAPYVTSGKADMSACTLTITDEREDGIIMGEPSVITQAVLIVPKNDRAASDSVRDYTEFKGKTIANITGVLTYLTTEKIGASPVYYTEGTAAIEDVRRGRVDGYMYALTSMRAIAVQPGNEDLEVIAVPLEFFGAQVAGMAMEQDVIDRFNAFLLEIKADGTLKKMQDRWLSAIPDLESPMPELVNNGENGVLKVATCSDAMPYAYMGENGQLKGYSVELALRFGAYEGKTVEFADMEFGGLIPYVISGKADLSIANMAITEERKKSVLFTDPICDEQHGIIALKRDNQPVVAKSGGFVEWIKTGVERNLKTDNRWRMIVDGLLVSMIISFAAQILGTVLGCLVCYLLLRKNRLARFIAEIYCGLIHGTPVVVLLMITYYIIFGNANLSSVAIAIAAFAIVVGAIVGQNLKGAIDTVDPVEIEAARSIGFTAFRAFIAVTLPQAVRRALPAYTNGFVELVKSTAIVGYIAIQDLTRAGDIIRSRTYDAYFPLLLVALIYLTVTTICVQLFKLVVKRMNGGAVQ